MTKKEMRKELWDYLKAEGINITPEQHEKIKALMERYIFEAAELTKATYKQAIGDLEHLRKGFNEYRKIRAARNTEKSKRKRERRAQRAQEAASVQVETVCVRTASEKRSVRPHRTEPPKSFLRDV